MYICVCVYIYIYIYYMYILVGCMLHSACSTEDVLRSLFGPSEVMEELKPCMYRHIHTYKHMCISAAILAQALAQAFASKLDSCSSLCLEKMTEKPQS